MPLEESVISTLTLHAHRTTPNFPPNESSSRFKFRKSAMKELIYVQVYNEGKKGKSHNKLNIRLWDNVHIPTE